MTRLHRGIARPIRDEGHIHAARSVTLPRSHERTSSTKARSRTRKARPPMKPLPQLLRSERSADLAEKPSQYGGSGKRQPDLVRRQSEMRGVARQARRGVRPTTPTASSKAKLGHPRHRVEAARPVARRGPDAGALKAGLRAPEGRLMAITRRNPSVSVFLGLSSAVAGTGQATVGTQRPPRTARLCSAKTTRLFGLHRRREAGVSSKIPTSMPCPVAGFRASRSMRAASPASVEMVPREGSSSTRSPQFLWPSSSGIMVDLARKSGVKVPQRPDHPQLSRSSSTHMGQPVAEGLMKNGLVYAQTPDGDARLPVSISAGMLRRRCWTTADLEVDVGVSQLFTVKTRHDLDRSKPVELRLHVRGPRPRACWQATW